MVVEVVVGGLVGVLIVLRHPDKLKAGKKREGEDRSRHEFTVAQDDN